MAKNNNAREFFQELADTLRYKRGEDKTYRYIATEIPEKIKDININMSGYFVSDSVLTTPSGFQGVESLVITQDVTNIAEGAYENFSALKNITFFGGKRILKDAFRGCTSLESVVLPDGLTIIAADVFNGCTNLLNVTFPQSLKRVDTAAFTGTAWLSKRDNGIVYAGDGICYTYKGDKTELEKIDVSGIKSVTASCFEGCANLSEVTINSDEQEGCYFAQNSFRNCTALKEVHINNVYAFEYGAFAGCTNITDYFFMNEETIPPFPTGAFPKISQEINLHVHPSMLDTWKADSQWSKFNII